MNVHSFNDIEGLRIAAEMERRGGEYYRRAAKLSHSPEAVDMLLFLAEDEARHLAEFEKLARRVAQERPDAPEYDADTNAYLSAIAAEIVFPGGLMALGAKHTGNPCHVYAVLGDGELQEGLVWEAAMSAAHYKLDNLTYIVDNNGLQIDGSNDQVMGLGNIAQKFTAFGFRVMEVADGNDLKQVLDALHQPAQKDVPTCILCHTVKGKGVSFMENQVGWHGKAPNAEQRDQALKELEA